MISPERHDPVGAKKIRPEISTVFESYKWRDVSGGLSMVRMQFSNSSAQRTGQCIVLSFERALQRDAKHEGQVSNISWQFVPAADRKRSEILRFASE
jgi:hypothetical protein